MSEQQQQGHILFVDDDVKTGELMLRFSEDSIYSSHVFQKPVEALAYFKEHGADMVITDLRMPGMTGLELMQAIRELDPDVPVVVITGYSSVENAIDALRLGATDFIKKPFDMEELFVVIDKTLQHSRLATENRLLKRQLKDERNRYGIIGHSHAIKEIFNIIDKVADIRCHVIIEGESGSGKELVARALHYQGAHAEKPFVVIDCGSLTDTLLESELFGHEKGAFTGAVQSKQGLLELASGGTVFLDEICNISDAMQMKLMRVIQEQQVTRVGGVKPVDIDVRVIAATNRQLEDMVASGNFRQDLYHRLNVVKILMPPLRERREDIPLLLQFFLDKYAEAFHREVKGFDAESMERLCNYVWPGNVRELSNMVERSVALADGPVLHVSELGKLAKGSVIDSDLPSLEELERRYILKLLDMYQGSREKTAATLGINKSTLWRRLQQYKSGEN